MLVSQNLASFATVLATLHAKCFEKAWSIKEIQALLVLPTTRLWINEYSFLLCSEVAGEMEILTIGVLPEMRKKGYGFQLMNSLEKYAECHQIEKIFLEVSQTNKAAQKLYFKAGFQKIGIRPGYYQTTSGSVDALCLGFILKKN